MLDPLKIAKSVLDRLEDEQSGVEKLSKYTKARIIVAIESEVRKAIRAAESQTQK